jgi:flagellar basal body rod protein FlgG
VIEAIRLSAAGARAQSLRHDVIANNLANVNTVGFRRQLALIGAEMARAGTTASQTAPVVAATLPTGGQGPLVPT